MPSHIASILVRKMPIDWESEFLPLTPGAGLITPILPVQFNAYIHFSGMSDLLPAASFEPKEGTIDLFLNRT